MTGPSHSGVELHGFLSYLVKVAVSGATYTVYGYKGKQVRDNIHSYDVIQAFEAFRRNPRPGEVYNLGGGRGNSISVQEALDTVQEKLGKNVKRMYSEHNRVGDHICYISDLGKLQTHYPSWKMSYSLDRILNELITAEKKSSENYV